MLVLGPCCGGPRPALRVCFVPPTPQWTVAGRDVAEWTATVPGKGKKCSLCTKILEQIKAMAGDDPDEVRGWLRWGSSRKQNGGAVTPHRTPLMPLGPVLAGSGGGGAGQGLPGPGETPGPPLQAAGEEVPGADQRGAAERRRAPGHLRRHRLLQVLSLVSTHVPCPSLDLRTGRTHTP